jgi:hypothetical protein
MSFGTYSAETKADLNLVDELGFAGLRAILVAQGFLAPEGLRSQHVQGKE